MFVLTSMCGIAFAANTTSKKVETSKKSLKIISKKQKVSKTTTIQVDGVCRMESIGVNDYGEVYWHRYIYYDCESGVRLLAWDLITDEVIYY